MDNFPHRAARDHRRPRRTEVQFHFAAIGAFKRRRQIAFKRQAAPLAKGWFDEAHVRPATPAHVAFLRRGALFAAKLADFRIQKAEADIGPGLERCGGGRHDEMENAGRWFRTGKRLETARVSASTIK